MAGTTQRVLRLLTLLQSRPVWTGDELAERLGVTTRSVRRDVGRLRDLDYPVHATQGVGCGGGDLDAMAYHLVTNGFPVEVLDPPPLHTAMRALAGRLVAATGGAGTHRAGQ